MVIPSRSFVVDVRRHHEKESVLKGAPLSEKGREDAAEWGRRLAFEHHAAGRPVSVSIFHSGEGRAAQDALFTAGGYEQGLLEAAGGKPLERGVHRIGRRKEIVRNVIDLSPDRHLLKELGEPEFVRRWLDQSLPKTAYIERRRVTLQPFIRKFLEFPIRAIARTHYFDEENEDKPPHHLVYITHSPYVELFLRHFGIDTKGQVPFGEGFRMTFTRNGAILRFRNQEQWLSNRELRLAAGLLPAPKSVEKEIQSVQATWNDNLKRERIKDLDKEAERFADQHAKRLLQEPGIDYSTIENYLKAREVKIPEAGRTDERLSAALKAHLKQLLLQNR